MRLNSTFRLAVTILIFAIALLLLENKRKHHNRTSDKAHSSPSTDEVKTIKASNTDYIFFEALSRYLFVSLQQ